MAVPVTSLAQTDPGGSVGPVTTRRVELFAGADPFVLESGATLAPVEVAYETYGQLNDDRSNGVFICHALTGDAHAAGHHGDPAHPGWWDNFIGPGKPVDTDRFFVICANLLGGCMGTTGPSSLDPATGEPLDDVLVFRVADEEMKSMWLVQRPSVYFTTEHFQGHPWILLRLPALAEIDYDELYELVSDAWLARAPKRVAKSWLADQGLEDESE